MITIRLKQINVDTRVTKEWLLNLDRFVDAEEYGGQVTEGEDIIVIRYGTSYAQSPSFKHVLCSMDALEDTIYEASR